MKHWAHIGIFLILGTATLLGIVRAAGINPGRLIYVRPAFKVFRLPSRLKNEIPPSKMNAPITVRLFAGQRLQTIWLKNSAGFLLSGQKVKSPIFIAVQDKMLSIYGGGRRQGTNKD